MAENQGNNTEPVVGQMDDPTHPDHLQRFELNHERGYRHRSD